MAPVGEGRLAQTAERGRPQAHQLLYVERQVLRLDDFECGPGWILDIGGGGDGMIGRLKGRQVVSIDTVRRELAAVGNESLKIVMNARELGFLDQSFATVTAFFSLMYMPADHQAQVIDEAHRVLRPGGELLIWDTAMPLPADPDKSHLMLPVTVCLPDGTQVRTGYGAPLKPQSLAYYADLGRRSGFTVIDSWSGDYLLHLRLRRPTG